MRLFGIWRPLGLFFAPEDGGAPPPATPPEVPPATPPAPETPAVPPADVTPPAIPPAGTPATTTEPTRTEGTTPAAPEKYELVLPDDSAHLTADDLSFLEAEAKAIGLSTEQAQQMVHAREAQLVATSARFLEDAKADPEIGGAQWDATVKHALAGRDFVFQGQELEAITSFFDRSGFGNHRFFIRAMARVGRALAEDTPLQGRPLTAPVEKTAADVLFGAATAK